MWGVNIVSRFILILLQLPFPHTRRFQKLGLHKCWKPSTELPRPPASSSTLSSSSFALQGFPHVQNIRPWQWLHHPKEPHLPRSHAKSLSSSTRSISSSHRGGTRLPEDLLWIWYLRGTPSLDSDSDRHVHLVRI